MDVIPPSIQRIAARALSASLSYRHAPELPQEWQGPSDDEGLLGLRPPPVGSARGHSRSAVAGAGTTSRATRGAAGMTAGGGIAGECGMTVTKARATGTRGPRSRTPIGKKPLSQGFFLEYGHCPRAGLPRITTPLPR